MINNINPFNQSKDLTHLLDVVFVDQYMAINEIVKNIKSISFHHMGVASQQDTEPAWAINRNGVAKQCTIHNELAITPRLSGFCKINFIPCLYH